MKRNVDLALWAPWDVIGKAREFDARVKSENKEFNLLWAELERVQNAAFIFKTNSKTIKYWEEMLGISPSKDASLSDRQRKVYIAWNKKVKWTHRTLLKWLDVAVGNESYDVKLYYNDYGIEFRIFMDKGRVDHDYLIRNLRQIIPANLGIIWTLVYRQNIYVGMYSMPLIKRTYHPYYPGDIRVNFSIFVGICQSYIKKTRTYKLPDVMIYDYDNFIETTLERGEKINYDRD